MKINVDYTLQGWTFKDFMIKFTVFQFNAIFQILILLHFVSYLSLGFEHLDDNI